MGSARPPRPKICGICHEDCSSRPRTKDSHGQYFCQACCDRVKKEQAERGTPPVSSPSTPPTSPPPPSADDGWDALAAAAADATAAAPVKVERDVYEHESPMHPPISPAVRLTGPRERQFGTESPREMPQFMRQPWFAFALPLSILGVLFAMGNGNTQVAIFALLLQSVFQLTVTVIILVQAFRTSVGTGLLSLCLPFYILYFLFGVQQNDHLKAAALAGLLSYVVALFMGVTLASALAASHGVAP